MDFLEVDYFRRLKECEKYQRLDECGECEDCLLYQEVFSQFLPTYVQYIGRLQQGITRIKFDPAWASWYTAHEKDLMILIIAHVKEKAAEQIEAARGAAT